MVVIENSPKFGCTNVAKLESMLHIPRIGENIIFDSTMYLVVAVIHCIDTKMQIKVKIVVDTIAAYE